MPWKGEKDPYKIWLSEIILQQTRVEQGMAYYQNFIEKYPNIQSLAKAKDQEVFKLWEGLGYYNRCKNLLFTARFIVNKLGGKFPDQYDELLQLKGIGPYTAAAIASFAYNLPYAVLDGNVFRVLARYFGIETPIDSNEGKKHFASLAEKVLDKKEAGRFNQAIMDFGATVCKPFSPGCSYCNMKLTCKASQLGLVNQLPIKEKFLQRKRRWFNYFLFKYDGNILVHHRTGKDIWQNLFEFYLVESEQSVDWDESSTLTFLKEQIGKIEISNINISAVFKQSLTHQEIKARFIKVKLKSVPAVLQKLNWHQLSKIQKLPFPKIIHSFFEAEKQS